MFRTIEPLSFLAVSPLAEYREHVRTVMRHDAFAVALGLSIVLLGCTAILASLIRRRNKDSAAIWFGLFALLYGVRLLMDTDVVPFALSISDRAAAFTRAFITYVIPIPAIVFVHQVFASWKPLVRWVLAVFVAFATSAIAVDIILGRPGTLYVANNVMALLMSVIFALAVFRKQRMDPGFRALRWGVAAFLITVVIENLQGIVLPRLAFNPEPLGFAGFLAALGYLLAVRTFRNEERLRELNKELEIATRIQLSILPRDMPEAAGLTVFAQYLPMTAVAGDFYDFLRIDDTRIGILIADVSGHGVPAALIASMVKIAIAAQLPHADDPGRVLSGMNQTLCGKMQGQFVSAAYVYFDLNAGVLRYAAGGHPPLLWWKAAEQRVETVEENGLLLGIMARAQYTSTERHFEPGDRFLMYTDGLMEAANEAEEFFGEDRVRETLAESSSVALEDCARNLLNRLRRFAGHDRGRSQDDDLTVIVLDIGQNGLNHSLGSMKMER